MNYIATYLPPIFWLFFGNQVSLHWGCESFTQFPKITFLGHLDSIAGVGELYDPEKKGFYTLQAMESYDKLHSSGRDFMNS